MREVTPIELASPAKLLRIPNRPSVGCDLRVKSTYRQAAKNTSTFDLINGTVGLLNGTLILRPIW